MRGTRRTDRTYADFANLSLDHAKPTLGRRYAEWMHASRQAGLGDVEQIVDYYNIPFAEPRVDDYVRRHCTDESAAALLDRFHKDTWGYYMPLSPAWSTLGRTTRLKKLKLIAKRRASYRLNLIFAGLEHVLDGGVADRSLLDIACNWGGFAIEARLRGATPVSAFDIRADNITKAEALRAHLGLDGVDFEAADIFQYQSDEQFDVVLNLGLMYHITQPVEMMRKTFDLTRHVAVIDTVTHREAFSGFVLGTGTDAVEHAATAVGVELHPTYRGLVDLAYLVGFSDVVEVHGDAPPNWDDFPSDIYGNKTRRCIICIK